MTDPTPDQTLTSPEQARKICSHYGAGKSAPTIAALTGVPAHRVREVLREAGYALSGGSRSAKDQHWPAIERLVEQGESYLAIAEQTGVPYQTLLRWAREEGNDTGAGATAQKNAHLATVLKMAQAGSIVPEIADATGVKPRTISRWLSENGVRTKARGGKAPIKRDTMLPRVKELHEQGLTIPQIRAAMDGQVSEWSIGNWLRQEGYKPTYGEATWGNKPDQERAADPRQDGAVRRYVAGETIGALRKDLHVAQHTLERWMREAGVLGQGGKAKIRADRGVKALELFARGLGVDAIADELGTDYYSARLILEKEGADLESRSASTPRAQGLLKDSLGLTCPCGERTGSKFRKYHDDACKAKYGGRREADPENWTTTTCAGCSVEFRHRKSQPRKYHDDECARTHTKHRPATETEGYVNGVWYQRSYEAAFLSVLVVIKLGVRRYDRAADREATYGERRYGPDFVVATPRGELAVEVKGQVREHNARQWAAYREQVGPLAVVDQARLLEVMASGSRTAAADLLWGYADDPRGL